jgi:arsenite methyltransferase
VTDLMYRAEIARMVREAYRALDLDDRPPRAIAPYPDDVLASLPPAAARWSIGTGHPVGHAQLRPGETVVDLGCGAGADAVLAAREVGPEGRVVGVDMLPEMCRRARRNAAEAGAAQVTVVQAEVESLPLRDASADVILSNGVVSLSARKARLFAEAARVLHPAGRLVVSDMTLDEEDLPSEVLVHPSAWAG